MGVKQHLQYRYDSRGHRSGLTAPDGGRFTYNYDVVGRLQAVVNPQAQRTTFQYDLAGRRTGTLLANGGRTSTVYDAASRITAVYNRKSDGTPQTTFEYGYDNSGNRTSVVDVDGRRTTWTYDAARQLESEHRGGVGGYRHTFTYDSRGNRTLKIEDGLRTTYAYDAANQLRHSDAAGGRTTYVYDADGNQQVTIEPTGERTTNVWDYENRMASAQLPTGLRNTMAYDPDGLRVKLEESGGTKKFVWDDQNYLAQSDGSDVIQTVYTVEPQTYGNLISHRQGGATTWYQFDALGSTRALTDATQALLETYHYGAWGTLLDSPPLLTPFLWVGRIGYHWDAQTQNQYVRARYYRPVIVRWVSVDPISRTISIGIPMYASPPAILLVDPSGLKPDDICSCCRATINDVPGYPDTLPGFNPKPTPRPGRPPGTGIIEGEFPSPDDRICHLKVRCSGEEGCPYHGGNAPGSTKATPKRRRGRPALLVDIEICISCAIHPDHYQWILAHEFKHAYDLCRTPTLGTNREDCISFVEVSKPVRW